jgi:hypothetical protein
VDNKVNKHMLHAYNFHMLDRHRLRPVKRKQAHRFEHDYNQLPSTSVKMYCSSQNYCTAEKYTSSRWKNVQIQKHSDTRAVSVGFYKCQKFESVTLTKSLGHNTEWK